MYRCEHGIDIENKKCHKCDEQDRDKFARSLSSLSDEAFYEAMAQYDRNMSEERR